MACTLRESAHDDDADRIVAATLYLMSCHARSHCPRLAVMIERHLQLLAGHAGSGAHVADTCRKLSCAWRAIARHDENLPPPAARPPHDLH